MPINLDVNAKLGIFLTKPQPIKVAIGGRGSGKSLGIGDMLIVKMLSEKSDVLCLREFQGSISDSVHKVFKGSIQDRLKLKDWSIQANTVIAPNGASTKYLGANRNPDAMQSAQAFKYSWFEEAHRASQDSIDKLLPTILRNPGAQCWFSANPQSSADPFSDRFINPYLTEILRDGFYEDDLHYIVMINWRDNPWWNEEQEALRAWDEEHLSGAKYRWIWEGSFYDEVENSIIPVDWFNAAIDAHVKLGFKPNGCKVASHDPSDLGPDDKGYCLRHGSVILDVCTMSTGDVNEGCDWALDKAIAAKADHFLWDCDGMGVSLRRQVIDALDGKTINPVMFKGSEGVDEPGEIYQGEDHAALSDADKTNKETFKNKRAQYYWRLRDRFYATYKAVTTGQYTDPDEMISLSSNIAELDKLRSEVCRIPRRANGNGLIQISTKIEMAKMGIASPNMADALYQTMINPTPNGVEPIKLNFASRF